MKHSQATRVHVPFTWTYADEAERTGATGFLYEDLGKMAWQQDNNTYWILIATTPTWRAVASAHTHVQSDITNLVHRDVTAIHTDSTAELSPLTIKSTPASSDILLIEDSADSFAKKKIKIGSINDTSWSIGATPPGSPTNGVGWYNTVDSILYVYDSSRTKWLSTARFQVSFGRSGNADGQFLRAPGDVESAGSGYLLPRNAAIIGIAAFATGGQVNKAFDIYIGGVSVASYALSTHSYYNSSLNINVNLGSQIGLWVSADGAGITDLVVVLEMAWRNV
jgi:hypothetical protein